MFDTKNNEKKNLKFIINSPIYLYIPGWQKEKEAFRRGCYTE